MFVFVLGFIVGVVDVVVKFVKFFFSILFEFVLYFVENGFKLFIGMVFVIKIYYNDIILL